MTNFTEATVYTTTSNELEAFLNEATGPKLYVGTLLLNDNSLFAVTATDPITGISSIEPVTTVDQGYAMYYFDASQTTTRVNPGTMTKFYGRCSYAEIYNANGDIISEQWDGDTFLTNRVTLSRINSDSHEGIETFVMDDWLTHETLLNGTLLTYVIYTENETVLHRGSALCMETTGYSDATPCHDILSVDLQSPFMRSGEEVIRPINVNVTDLNFSVLVTRSNGTETLPMGHPRVQVVGLDIVNLNQVQIPHDIALIYDATNQPVDTQVDLDNHITKMYKLTNIPANEFSPNPMMLLAYLTYAGLTEGWRMRVDLLVSDGSMLMDVTDIVTTGDYDSALVGTTQEFVISLDLGLVEGVRGDHTITQPIQLNITNFGGQPTPAFFANNMQPYIKPLLVVDTNGGNLTEVTLTDSVTYFLEQNTPNLETRHVHRINKFRVYDTLTGTTVFPISMLEEVIEFEALNTNDIIQIELLESYNDIELILHKFTFYI
jgi:hypothetical protein